MDPKPWAYADPIPPAPKCAKCRRLATRRYTWHDLPNVSQPVTEDRCEDHPVEGAEIRERPPARRRRRP